jgi:hypothetical protein
MSDLLMGLITNGAMSKAKIVALCKGAMVCGEIAARE